MHETFALASKFVQYAGERTEVDMLPGFPKKGKPREEVLDELKALNAGGLVERAVPLMKKI